MSNLPPNQKLRGSPTFNPLATRIPGHLEIFGFGRWAIFGFSRASGEHGEAPGQQSSRVDHGGDSGLHARHRGLSVDSYKDT